MLIKDKKTFIKLFHFHSGRLEAFSAANEPAGSFARHFWLDLAKIEAHGKNRIISAVIAPTKVFSFNLGLKKNDW